MAPPISFLIPVYNVERYLPRALASLRWQSVTDWEAVCVNDGSTDGTLGVLERFAAADPRFRIVDQPNGGLVAALNRGLEATRGEWVARMDGDDVSTPDRLRRQLEHMAANPGCVAAGAQVLHIDPDGAPIGPAPHSLAGDEIERRLLTGQGGTLAHPTLFARRETLLAVGGYRHEHERVQDTDLLLRLARVGPLANLPETLLLYRQHANNYCRRYHAEIRTEMLTLLRAAHADRGLALPEETAAMFTGPSRQTPLVGKWARRAARHGHLRTAAKLGWEQLRSAPVSAYSARVAAECVLRGGVSLLRGRRSSAPSLPDWRAWDCPATSGSKSRIRPVAA